MQNVNMYLSARYPSHRDPIAIHRRPHREQFNPVPQRANNIVLRGMKIYCVSLNTSNLLTNLSLKDFRAAAETCGRDGYSYPLSSSIRFIDILRENGHYFHEKDIQGSLKDRSRKEKGRKKRKKKETRYNRLSRSPVTFA